MDVLSKQTISKGQMSLAVAVVNYVVTREQKFLYRCKRKTIRMRLDWLNEDDTRHTCKKLS
jgi:hypothetical protein